MLAAISGCLMGGTLIIAIGAQNSFLIEQSLKKQWTAMFVVLFIVSDAAGITLGALGFGLLLQQYPLLIAATKWAGVVFLLLFAAQRIKASMASDAMLVKLSSQPLPLRRAILTALAVTWLNPHFYLDTLLLMGNLASQWHADKWWFVAGAIAASVVWFVGLSTLTSLCANWMREPKFWRWFNRLNAVVLGAIGLQLATL